MKIKNAIEFIADTPSVTGYEYLVHQKVMSLCDGIFDTAAPLRSNSLIAVKKCGKDNAPKLLLNAHIDEIGMYVTAVHDGGFLSVINVGGIDTNILYASQVTIYGKKEIKGVFVSTPPHLSRGASELDKISKLVIDTGLEKDELKEIVEIGTPVGLDGSVDILKNDLVSARAMDDRICMIAIIRAVEMLKNCDVKYDIYALFSAQKEVTSLGAVTGVWDVKPDMALVVDVGHAKMKGIDKIGALKLSKGPAISFSATTSRKLSEALCKSAQTHKIPFQRVSEANYTGTDAHDIQTALEGIPSSVISVPLRNMHTPCEIISIEDVENTASLIASFVKDAEYFGEEVQIIG
ncbi:MAG: hypothetical protein IJO52_01980 [Clostridia bacterium]|nr:hypothetical protein [Clostridia bacterium]